MDFRDILRRINNITRLPRWLKEFDERWTWRLRGYWRSTPAGSMFSIVLGLSVPVTLYLRTRGPLYIFTVFLLTLLACAAVAKFIFRPRVEVDRDLPERCPAGAVLKIRARVRNRNWLPAFDLAVGEFRPDPSIRYSQQPEYLDCLQPRESAEVEYRFTPTRRGAYEFPGPVAMSAFPFGLYHHTRRFRQPRRMLVYPAFARLNEIALPVGRKHQPGGLQLVSNVGDSEEFLGNRGYLPGDRLRDIDYRAWARVGFPVVREYRQEYLCRVALIADTFCPYSDAGAEDDLEALLSLAAGISDALSRQEYVIDIFAAGPDLYQLQAGRSLAYLDNILDLLACIAPCRTNPLATLAPALVEELAQISTAVIVLLDWDERRETFVRELRGAGLATKVVVVRGKPPTHDPLGYLAEAGAVTVLAPDDVKHGVDRL